MSRAIYLYCVVRSGRKPREGGVPPGLPGAERPAPVRLADRIWLVTASVPLEQYGPEALETSLRDIDWVSTIALAHEAVVEYYARSPAATVIPMKLFTMFSTDGRAASAMRRRQRALERVFDRIEGCEEWGVRITRVVARRSAEARGSSTGTEFLAARRAARDRAAAETHAVGDAADAAFTSLSALAREARRRTDEPHGVTAPVLDAAFLVPVRGKARFQAAARNLARQVAKNGARMTVTGPWPAYNFVEAHVGEKRG